MALNTVRMEITGDTQKYVDAPVYDPMMVTIEASGEPYDVVVKTADGQQLGDVLSVEWRCDLDHPMPRATVVLECVGTSLQAQPSIVLRCDGDLRIPLPDGLSLGQVRELQTRIGPILTQAELEGKRLGRALRELSRRGMSDEDLVAVQHDPESDIRL